MKRMTLIVVAALVVVVLPLCGRCSHEDHENRRQRVFDRLHEQDRDRQARQLAEQRNALLRQQNAIMQDHADHPFGRRW